MSRSANVAEVIKGPWKVSKAKTHKRPIRTDYYRGNKIVKRTNSSWANNAVGNAVKHMRARTYDSTHCEVYDELVGTLHAVIRYYRRQNQIEILFKRKATESEWSNGTT